MVALPMVILRTGNGITVCALVVARRNQATRLIGFALAASERLLLGAGEYFCELVMKFQPFVKHGDGDPLIFAV